MRIISTCFQSSGADEVAAFAVIDSGVGEPTFSGFFSCPKQIEAVEHKAAIVIAPHKMTVVKSLFKSYFVLVRVISWIVFFPTYTSNS